MSTPTSGDLLLVNRGGVNYQIDYDDMSTLQDTDLLLVNRAGVNYQIAASDINLGPDGVILPDVNVLTPVNGSGLNEGDPYTPQSSAYVSTDSTPITHRYFPELITTVSGGSWVNENYVFDGDMSTYAELTGAAGVVSQLVFTPNPQWTDGETTVYAYASGGGSVEVLDSSDTVLRTYSLPLSAGSVAIGIVRVNENKIRITTTDTYASLFLNYITRSPVDYVISGRVKFEFTDDTDLDKMVAPIIMTDANGDVKVPTTSTVDSTTTISGEDKGWLYSFVGNGDSKTINLANNGVVPTGERMLWSKQNNSRSGIVASSNLNGRYLTTAYSSAQSGGSTSIQLNDGETVLNTSADFNDNGVSAYFTEIGVAPKVLDIVTWEGSNTSPRAIPHNLGCKPGMIIIKRYDSSVDWAVWHKDLNEGYILSLNQNYNQQSGDYFPSEPTATHFYVGNQTAVNNSFNYVAYVFAAETAGKVKCGYYDGSNSDQSIILGFRPGFFLTKAITNSYDWVATNSTLAYSNLRWYPNRAMGFEGNSSYYIDLNDATKVNFVGNAPAYNTANHKYVYLAIAEDLTGPDSTQLNLLSNQDLEYFTDGTPITSNLEASGSNYSFAAQEWPGNSDTRNINPYVDGQYFFDLSYEAANKWMVWIKATTGPYSHGIFDSERGFNRYFNSNDETRSTYSSDTLMQAIGNTAYKIGSSALLNLTNVDYVSWNFKAAPQFFDVQKYIGNSGTNTIQHDLGVEPGCVILKSLQTADWWVYHSGTDANPQNYGLKLNSANNIFAFNGWFTATDTDFTITASSSQVNTAGQDYIAYLFAKDTPYVKCGSYVASGNDNFQVDVGFKPRWVLIKSSVSNYSWVILDKLNPNQRIQPNTNDALDELQWSFTDTGFTLRDVINSASVNSYGSSYIYVAIADETEGHPPFPPSSTTVQGTPDVNAATMVVNAESFDVGDSASAPALEASITSVAGSDGNALLVDSSTGTWLPGLYAKGSETTVSAPSADEVTFTSTNAGTTPFSGVDATLSSRTWTLESAPSATGPWTVVDTYVDYDALASQDGATPWSSNKPALTADTFYRVKVQYDSTNAESVESVYSTFKTSA